MSDATETPTNSSAKANSASFVLVTIVGAVLTILVDQYDPNIEKYEDLMVVIRHGIPAGALGGYFCIMWFWSLISPDGIAVIKGRKDIKRQIRDCNKLMSSGDLSIAFEAEIRSKKEKLQLALIDSRAVTPDQ